MTDTRVDLGEQGPAAAAGHEPFLVSATPTGDHPGVRGTARLLVHAMPGFDGAPTRASTLLFVPDSAMPEEGWARLTAPC